MYGVENDGWLPSKPPEAPSKFASRTGVDVWFLKLFPTYLGEPMALTCPSDPFRFRMADIRSKTGDPAVADYASYGINSLIMLGAGGKLADLDRNGPSRPGDTILLADLGPDRELAFAPPVTHSYTAKGPSKKTVPKGPSRNESLLAWDDGYDPVAVRSDTWLTARHGRGINMLTVGGSVRSVQTTQLLRSPIQNYYKDCSAGGCALCRRQLGKFLNHYTFAKDRLFWWVGPIPPPE